jgi:hypothetical protein
VRRGIARAGVTAAATALITLAIVGTAAGQPPPPPPPASPLDVRTPAAAPTEVPPRTIPDSHFAPVDRPGPALSVPEDLLDQALSCTANTATTERDVVLFVHGTTLTPESNFGWNWFRALDALGRPYCAVTMPNNAMSDAQISAEYVVHAIRAIHERSGQQVQILGHSQGGTEPRFALRFWPDLRAMVEDYVTFAGTNHGSIAIDLSLCTPRCAPALWQQTLNSDYTQAINSYQETFDGISYTQIYTVTDQFVQPNLNDRGTTSLHTGDGEISNIAVQDVCPATVNDHISVGTYDPVAHALTMDALDHDGPAEPDRIPASVCTEQFMPGVNPVQFPADLAGAYSVITEQLALHPRVAEEPALADYTLADPE